MKKLVTAALLSGLMVVGVTSAPAAMVSKNIVKLSVSATGANVSMASNMKVGGSKVGSATGTFQIDTKKNTFCYNVKTVGLANVLEAHIHVGAAGADGADIVPFNVAKFNKAGLTCIKSTAKILGGITMDPANYYFNVHTKAYADGAVRGQLALTK